MASNRIFKELKHLQIFKQLRLSPSWWSEKWWSEKPAKLAGLEEDGSVELHKSAGLRDRGVKKDQDHSDRDRDRDRDRLSRSKRKPTDEMIGFFCSKKSSSAMALDAPIEAPPQVGKGNAKVAVSLVGYDQELKDGRCAETDDILPDGFKLKRKMVFYYMSYAMGRGCLKFGEMMQKISDLKDGSTMKRLYMEMEMERVIKFPHTHVDRRPRKRPRLGWDIAPQALKEGATKEDIERLPKYKFRRIGDFEKQNGEIQESFGGIITECDTDSPIEHVLSPENAECCICLCPYEDGTELRELPCRHHFHCSCIDKWLYINATCPLCKFNILKNGNQSSSEEV